MEICIKRTEHPDCTEGKMYIKWTSFSCDTLEDVNRDKNKNGKFDGDEKKVYGDTCIPYGRYEVTLKVVSPKFSKYKQYQQIQGKLPRLIDVPHFEGILIHIGNTVKDTDGCILVGKRIRHGFVSESTVTFYKLYEILKKASDAGEKIWLEIT